MLTSKTWQNLNTLGLIFLGFGGNVVKLSAWHFKLNSAFALSLLAQSNPLSCTKAQTQALDPLLQGLFAISFPRLPNTYLLSFMLLFVCPYPILSSLSVLPVLGISFFST